MNQANEKHEKNGKHALIIGAGLSGLAAGCYLLMNGYRVTVLEMHAITGGSCTAWEIKHYQCDYTISWMPGCGNLDHKLTTIWRELGAIQNKSVKHFDIYNTVVADDGTQVHFYVNPDKLQQHLLALSPVDEKPIKKLCGQLRKFREFVDVYSDIVLQPQGLMSLWERTKLTVRLLPFMKLFMQSMGTTMTKFAQQFQSPAIRQSLNSIFYLSHHDDFPILPYLYNMSFTDLKLGGCPEGGSRGLAQSIEQRFRDLGGEILFGRKVEAILVDQNRAVGARDSDGTEYAADVVVSTADIHTTMKSFLGDRFTPPRLQKLFKTMEEKPEGLVFEGVVGVFIGVNRDMSDQPHSVTGFFSQEEVDQIPGAGVVDRSYSIHVRSNMFPGTAPPGKSLLLLTCLADERSWEALDHDDAPKSPPKKHTARKRTRAYKEAKKHVGEVFLQRLETFYPDIREDIEFVNVSTPLTIMRYAGTRRGSILGWVPFSPDSEPFMDDIKKHGPGVPGLKNCYLAGQWVEGCGVFVAATSGRHAAQYICRDHGKPFETSEPKLPLETSRNA